MSVALLPSGGSPNSMAAVGAGTWNILYPATRNKDIGHLTLAATCVVISFEKT
jgi:hypothetical protein